MEVHKRVTNSGNSFSAERLVAAALELWESQGHAAISARSLAQAAGLPTSSIYHHFGAMEHLFIAAQGAASSRAGTWCRVQLDAVVPASPLPREAFGPLLAALIDDWTKNQRRLALAWRECHLMAARDPRYLPSLAGWRRVWAPFWQTLCARFGLEGHAELIACLFEGESVLHLMQWRRPVDRCCLDELCRGLDRWLSGSLAPEGPWRQFARQAASGSMPALAIAPGMGERIAGAAADVVEQLGMAGLTHRAVAAMAGVTLGVVTYNFPTSADLARAAFEMIYRRLVPSGEALMPPDLPAPQVIDRFTEPQHNSAHLLAMDELLLAVARDSSLRAYAPQLRYQRGRSSGPVLQAIVGPGRIVSSLDGALMSGLTMGLQRALVGLPPQEAEACIRRVMGVLLETIGVAAPSG